MLCLSPFDGHRCGHCLACRLEKQREKKTRILHEAQYFDKKCFMTLTYDPKRFDDLNLVKKDLQDFIKRVRRHMEPTRLKYFACGEYGTKGERHHAHYHIIWFGLDVYDKVFTARKWIPNDKLWRVECPTWEKGFVTVGKFNEARASYIAKYCLKKVTGKWAPEHYQGRQPEFALFSQGLGLAWLKDHTKLVLQDGFIREKNKRVPLPRYYEQKLFPLPEDKMCPLALAYKEKKQQVQMSSFDNLVKRSRSGLRDLVTGSYEDWKQRKAEALEKYQKYLNECRKQIALRVAVKEQRKGKEHNV